MKETKELIHKYINEHSNQLIELLQNLIKIKSINPWFTNYKGIPKESEVQEYIKTFLDQLQFSTHIWEPDWKELQKYNGKNGYFPGRDFKNRSVLYSELKGTGNGRSIMLTGHVDVVLDGKGWTKDPYGGEIIDGKLYGRGTVDMKGGIASMLFAVKAIVDSGITLKGDIKIGTVPDEEAGGMGSLAFIDKGYRADGGIMTEPTDLRIAPLCRGILWGKLIIKGRAALLEVKQKDWKHGGGVDAINFARIYLNAIADKNKEWAILEEKNHQLIPSSCQIQIAQINAGDYPTTFADQCEIVFNIQYLPSERDVNKQGGNVKMEFEEFVRKQASNHDWLVENPPVVEWILDADCAEVPVESEFMQSIIQSAQEIGLSPTIEGMQSHTDMGWFCNSGTPTINFGAGDPMLCHQDDEFIKIEELITATKLLAISIINWCGENKK